jgi:hypothetical protein
MLPELEEAQRELNEEFRFWRLLTSAEERTKENPRKLLTEAFPPCAMNESAWSNTVVMKVSGIESNRLRGVAMENESRDCFCVRTVERESAAISGDLGRCGLVLPS